MELHLKACEQIPPLSPDGVPMLIELVSALILQKPTAYDLFHALTL
jgi:hypothetical protein